MTTNQTIDGVPRELLERFDSLDVDGYQGWAAEAADVLRALMDEPACKTCGDSGWVAEPLSIRGNTLECPECKPAAQPRAEPVAVMNDGREGEVCTWFSRPPKGTKLYAEQPAPVAVVMPDRFHQVMQYLMGAGDLDGYYFKDSHQSGRKYWWRNELRACLDEVTRLNGSKP